MKKVGTLILASVLMLATAACSSDDSISSSTKECSEAERLEMESEGCCCEYGMVGDLECHANGEWYCPSGTYWYGLSECMSENGPCFIPNFEADVSPTVDPGFAPDEGPDPGIAQDEGQDPGPVEDQGADVLNDPGSEPDIPTDMGTTPPPDPGTPDPGTPDPGAPDPGAPEPGDVTPPQDTAAPSSDAPWATNLVTNPGAEDEDLNGWSILQNGGDGWAVSGTPYAGDKSFITSFALCLRAQEIDLLAWGFTEEELDNEPLVVVSEWFREMYDGGDIFKLKVELRDATGEPLASWIQNGETAGSASYADDSWFELTHTFSAYGSGLRTIYWEDGGQDGEYWAGHYGIRMDEASLQLIPSSD